LALTSAGGGTILAVSAAAAWVAAAADSLSVAPAVGARIAVVVSEAWGNMAKGPWFMAPLCGKPDMRATLLSPYSGDKGEVL
jgi:hypothetical protein